MEKRILVIDQNDSDYSRLDRHLGELQLLHGSLLRCVTVQEAFLCGVQDISLIILGLPVTGIESLTALQLLHSHFQGVPMVGAFPDLVSMESAKQSGLPVIGMVKSNFDAVILEAAITKAFEQQNDFFTLKLKHATYRRHFYNGHVPMWIYDTESLQILEVNDSAVKKYGYRKEEFISMTILDLHPREDVDSFIEILEARELSQFDIGYWRHLKKNGETFFVNIYTHYTNHENRETGMSFAFDVSDKLLEDLNNKNSKNLVKGQKEQFDSILSTLSDAIWSIRADTLELIYANSAFYNLFGFTPEEMTANIDPFFSLIHPEDQKAFRQSMQSVTYTHPSRVEYRYNHRDGTQKTLQAHVSLIKGVDGKPDTLNGVTVDITNERALQDKIRKSEQNLLATINNTKDLIWSVNTNLEIIFCNKPYQEFVMRIWGKLPKPGDYVLSDGSSESFASSRLSDYKRALAGESFITIIEENYNGDILYQEFSNNPIIDHKGKIVGVNCIARDISEQRKQYLKIREQNEKLIEIAWIQSHKVRSPVASILGLAELFDFQASGNEHNAEILDLIKTATFQLDDIIREVVEKTEILGQGE